MEEKKPKRIAPNLEGVYKPKKKVNDNFVKQLLFLENAYWRYYTEDEEEERLAEYIDWMIDALKYRRA